MKRKINLAVATICMLCCAFIAQAQPLAITGTDTVCVGTSATYSTPAVPFVHYLWSVTLQGNISGPNTNPSVLILWCATGTATVTVQAFDTLNNPVGVGTLLVYVAPIPTPYITANKTVGCQTLPDSSGPNTPGDQTILDDSSGCVKVCEGSVVTYKGHGPAGSTFGWLVTGGTILIAGGDSCVVHWGTAGPGSVKVID